MLRLLGRYIFREILTSAVLGTLLATFVIFLQRRGPAVRAAGEQHQRDRAAWCCSCSLLAMPPVLPLDHSVRRAGGHSDRPGPHGGAMARSSPCGRPACPAAR